MHCSSYDVKKMNNSIIIFQIGLNIILMVFCMMKLQKKRKSRRASFIRPIVGKGY